MLELCAFIFKNLSWIGRFCEVFFKIWVMCFYFQKFELNWLKKQTNNFRTEILNPPIVCIELTDCFSKFSARAGETECSVGVHFFRCRHLIFRHATDVIVATSCLKLIWKSMEENLWSVEKTLTPPFAMNTIEKKDRSKSKEIPLQKRAG